MSTTANAIGKSTNTIEKTYDQEIERLEEVVDVRSDLDFTSIFANLIRKMDDAAQAAVA